LLRWQGWRTLFHMKPSSKNMGKGIGREAKGAVKEAAGKLTGNRKLAVEGKIQKHVGKAQRKLGKAESDVESDLERDLSE
jgi:uncharacterized protein YjbJ (UPF0337 family)